MLDNTKKHIARISDYLFNKYEWLISLLLKLNFVKVDKERYIRRIVKKFYGDDCQQQIDVALETSLSDVLTEKQQWKVYRRMMWKYGFIVFCVSFALTLVPEDLFFTILSCALDLAIFQCFMFIAMQKILLLYGDGCDMHNDETKSVETIISIDSSGLMIGKYPILQKMKSVLGWLGKQVVKKLGPKFVTKASRSVFLVVRRQAVKWTSMIVAKEDIDVVFNAIIPFTCAVISGLVSVVIFVPMCNKLRKHLCEQARK